MGIQTEFKATVINEFNKTEGKMESFTICKLISIKRRVKKAIVSIMFMVEYQRLSPWGWE